MTGPVHFLSSWFRQALFWSLTMELKLPVDLDRSGVLALCLGGGD